MHIPTTEIDPHASDAISNWVAVSTVLKRPMSTLKGFVSGTTELLIQKQKNEKRVEHACKDDGT